MTKKGENIYKRKDGRWEGRYIKARNSAGKIIYGSVYGKKYSEVKEKLVYIKAKHLETTRQMNPYYGNFSNWIKIWMTTKTKNQVKATTYSNYCRLIEKHILPILGELPLSKTKVKDLQNFIFTLQKKQLSAGSIKNIFNIVNKCMKDAKKEGFILENPCEFVDLPKMTKKEIKPLTMRQQRRLELVAFQNKKCSPIILALYSGMRIGEISGLKWSDIDFENNFIYVRRTVSRISDENTFNSKTRLVEGTPKSTNSNRQIPLATNLKSYLLEKKKQATCDYVIESENGLTEPRSITNQFKKVVRIAELNDINFHLLRHTFATRCIENGIDIASLSKILGHQSVKMTLDTYTNSLMETRRTAMDKIDHLFYQSS
ncbi:tyrosine-type recombinase/integrase [Enterococcus faecalis]